MFFSYHNSDIRLCLEFTTFFQRNFVIKDEYWFGIPQKTRKQI